LLIDDASGDTTLENLHRVAAAYPQGWVKVLSLSQNAGPGGARNLGWDESTQPWLAFLDADDAWHPRKIEIQYAWLHDYPEAILCGHVTKLAPAEGQYPDVPTLPRAWRVSFLHMLIANRFPTRSVMLRRDLSFRFEKWRHSEDYLLWLRVVLTGQPCYRLEAPLAVSFRADSSAGGLSGQLWRHEKQELRAWLALRRLGAISSLTAGIALAWSLLKYVRRALR
jgi:glycosyltransferase involved in cell wall biosynthesis